MKSRCFGLMEKIAAIPTLTNWIKDVTIWLQFFQGSVCMSETKTEGLIYKGHPLRRIDNLIYYGTMADPYIVMMQILESKKENGLDLRIESDGEGGLMVTAQTEGKEQVTIERTLTENQEVNDTLKEDIIPEPSFWERAKGKVMGICLACLLLFIGTRYLKNKFKNNLKSE